MALSANTKDMLCHGNIVSPGDLCGVCTRYNPVYSIHPDSEEDEFADWVQGVRVNRIRKPLYYTAWAIFIVSVVALSLTLIALPWFWEYSLVCGKLAASAFMAALVSWALLVVADTDSNWDMRNHWTNR